MKSILFEGVVTTGAGLFALENQFREDCIAFKSVDGWPSYLLPGTLNVSIIHPDSALGVRNLRTMDRNEKFRPAVYLDGSVIDENTITPTSHGAFGGDLQFWRAVLDVPEKDVCHHCFMLRRVGSAYETTIELVSDRMLRSRFGLQNGDVAKVLVLSG